MPRISRDLPCPRAYKTCSLIAKAPQKDRIPASHKPLATRCDLQDRCRLFQTTESYEREWGSVKHAKNNP